MSNDPVHSGHNHQGPLAAKRRVERPRSEGTRIQTVLRYEEATRATLSSSRAFKLNFGRDYSTVDGRSRRTCYWTRASCDHGTLQIGDVEFLSNDFTNPNTNPKALTTLALSLANHHDAYASFCAPLFCDFVQNYSCTVDGAVVT